MSTKRGPIFVTWTGSPHSNPDLLQWWVNINYDLKSGGLPVFSPSDPRLKGNFLNNVHTGFKVFPDALFIHYLHNTEEDFRATQTSIFLEQKENEYSNVFPALKYAMKN